jgi:hypothetical protein
MLKRLILASALVLPAVQAQAADIMWWKKSAPNSYGIKISGDTTTGDYSKFKRTLDSMEANQSDTITVHLSGPGGSGDEAFRIGKAIRSYGFETYVAFNTDCASACALIWLGGKERIWNVQARIGFHNGYIHRRGDILEPVDTFTAKIKDYLSKLGYDDAVFTYVTKAPPTGMEWLSVATDNQYHLSTMKCSGGRCQ